MTSIWKSIFSAFLALVILSSDAEAADYDVDLNAGYGYGFYQTAFWNSVELQNGYYLDFAARMKTLPFHLFGSYSNTTATSSLNLNAETFSYQAKVSQYGIGLRQYFRDDETRTISLVPYVDLGASYITARFTTSSSYVANLTDESASSAAIIGGVGLKYRFSPPWTVGLYLKYSQGIGTASLADPADYSNTMFLLTFGSK